MRINKRRILREIKRLLNLALKPMDDVCLADRYVELARELSMKSRVRIPRELKYFICKGCKRILIPGKTARFRIRRRGATRMIVTCLRCGHVYRRLIKKN